MLSFIKNLGLAEISLVQVIFYGLVWFIDDYFAILMTSILVTILVAILIISLISELIEKSKVPSSFFKTIGVSIVIPIVVALFFVTVTLVLEFDQ